MSGSILGPRVFGNPTFGLKDGLSAVDLNVPSRATKQ